jgi:hypothetical protein
MARRSVSKKSTDEVRPDNLSQGLETEPYELRAVHRACRKYGTALRHGLLPLRADGDSETQLMRYSMSQERLAQRTTEIKQLLSAAGVSVIRFLAYCNFGYHIDKFSQEYDGRALEQEARIAVARWVAKGLDQKILEEICLQVFTIDLTETGAL